MFDEMDGMFEEIEHEIKQTDILNQFENNFPGLIAYMEEAAQETVRIFNEVLNFTNTKVFLSELDENGELRAITGKDEKNRWIIEAFYKEHALMIKHIMEKDPAALEALKRYLEQAIVNPPPLKQLPQVKTKIPGTFITPTDRINKLAFIGKIGTNTQIAMENRRSKKQITTIANINFDDLDKDIQIKVSKELTPYDKEVHDSVITLYTEGQNEYITTKMIYQVMTGSPGVSVSPKQENLITESLTKLRKSLITINADQEGREFYGLQKLRYEGQLIHWDKVTATLNGETTETYHILRRPILYEYANTKNQIGRFDIKILDTPIKKNEEIILLQGYLTRQILAMKGGKISKNILFETVFSAIGLTASSEGALRVKKSKVRDQVKLMLDYWIKEEFIKGYTQNMKGKTAESMTIIL